MPNWYRYAKKRARWQAGSYYKKTGGINTGYGDKFTPEQREQADRYLKEHPGVKAGIYCLMIAVPLFWIVIIIYAITSA